MNLMTMQFGSFVFPVNPTELKLERACLLRETVGVDGEEREEAVGKRRGARSGQGALHRGECDGGLPRVRGAFR